MLSHIACSIAIIHTCIRNGIIWQELLPHLLWALVYCSDLRIILLYQTIFHCDWLALRGLGDHLSHFRLSLLEVID